MQPPPDTTLPIDNVRSLLQFVADGIDQRLHKLRSGTRYESVRPSDVKVFAMALREPRRMADLARQLKISRQAVQMSVKRLSELKVVELQPIPGNSRDKYVVITDRGRTARKAAEAQLRQMETEIRAVIGKEGEDALRGLLVRLCEAFSPEEYVRGRGQVPPDSE